MWGEAPANDTATTFGTGVDVQNVCCMWQAAIKYNLSSQARSARKSSYWLICPAADWNVSVRVSSVHALELVDGVPSFGVSILIEIHHLTRWTCRQHNLLINSIVEDDYAATA